MNCINSITAELAARCCDILRANIYLNKFDIYREAVNLFHYMVLPDRCELASVKHYISAIINYKVTPLSNSSITLNFKCIS